MNSELLLPVGNMEMCLAAVHHGADAIYVGVPFFNARGRTTDLTMEELKEMVELCHLYGVKVNLAFNVVIFQNEIPKVISLLEQILPLNPDAFIVQDLGLAKIIRSMAPHQRIHASTQMTVTNADAIRLVEDLKIDRFVQCGLVAGLHFVDAASFFRPIHGAGKNIHLPATDARQAASLHE
jgi:putative protease